MERLFVLLVRFLLEALLARVRDFGFVRRLLELFPVVFFALAVDFFAPLRFAFVVRAGDVVFFTPGSFLTALVAALAAFTAVRLSARGKAGLPLPIRRPTTAPTTPPTTAPTGPATAPTTAPVAAPAVDFEMGGISISSCSRERAAELDS